MAIKAAIDLGSSETGIYTLGGGVVLREPTVIALGEEGDKNNLRAIGAEAKKLIGKTAENTRIMFPVFEGEVVNERYAAIMLEEFLRKIRFGRGLSGGAVAAAVPCGAEPALIKKLDKVFSLAGIREAYFVEAPIAAAIGQHVPLSESTPCFVIDMGGGVTNIAALSLDGIIAGVSVGVGGKNIDVWLIDHIAEKFNLQVGLLTAERIKIQIGSLLSGDTLSAVVNGRDLSTGRPRSIALRAEDIAAPIYKYYDEIFEVAASVLSKLPPEVSAEIRHTGIYVSGGTAAAVGLESYYRRKFGMNVNVADNPGLCVITGLGSMIGNVELLKRVRINED